MRKLEAQRDTPAKSRAPAPPRPRNKDAAADNAPARPLQARLSTRPIVTGYADLVAAANGTTEQVRGQMGQAFGADFSKVRITPNSNRARSLGAAAFTWGDEIHFAPGHWAPETAKGRELLAHEFGHVVQQRQGRAHANANLDGVEFCDDPSLERDADAQARRAVSGQSPPYQETSGHATHTAPVLQRRIVPEDVAVEMPGRLFDMVGPYGPLKAGAVVQCMQWTNHLANAMVVLFPTPTPWVIRSVPKSLLAPHNDAVRGINSYSAGVEGQRATVVRSEQELAKWEAKRGEYKTSAQKQEFGTELSRLQGITSKRQELLNRKLIQETMFNRFDGVIDKEVKRQNTEFGLKAADALDPNLVKSMIFEESQMGTSGKFLAEGANTITRTRFNIGQVIDSSAVAHLTYFEAKESTRLVRWGMSKWRADLNAAKLELVRLEKKPSADPIRRAELIRLSKRYWETFLWEYKGTGAKTFKSRLRSVFRDTGENDTYDYWIKMMVFWLFKKYERTKSWPTAIRDYNGDDSYRARVMERAKEAAASPKRPYVPKKI